MKKTIPMLFTAIGGVLGSLYGFFTMGALILALIASDIAVPTDSIGKPKIATSLYSYRS